MSFSKAASFVPNLPFKVLEVIRSKLRGDHGNRRIVVRLIIPDEVIDLRSLLLEEPERLEQGHALIRKIDARRVNLDPEKHFKEPFPIDTPVPPTDIEVKEQESKKNSISDVSSDVSLIDDVDLDDPFRELTEEEYKELRKVFSNKVPRNEILVSHERSNIEITKEHLECLKNGAWLNDEVINLYLSLLKERELRDPKRFFKSHFFSTFFYKKLTSAPGYNYKSVKRWTSHTKLGYYLWECEKIFVPVHRPAHWCLAIIDVTNETIRYLDSLGGIDNDVLIVLATYFRDEALDKSDKDIDTRSWIQRSSVVLPRQENGYDCGMFMLKYIDFESRRRKFSFSQKNMPYFRNRTAIELLRKRAN